jgi:DnaJ family protein C protein 2
VESGPSQRLDSVAEMQGINVTQWTEDEQKLLEQALKTHPSSLGAVRWERIASCLPDRSKKDCMRRYKELAEIVRAKKAAMAATKAAS